MICPGCTAVTLSKRNAERPFWRALPKAEEISPSLETIVAMPISFAITCAHGRGVRRLDGACFVEALLQLRLGKRRETEALCNQFGRPHRVVGAADDELCLRRLSRSEHRLKRETRRWVEGPELAFVVELAPAPPLATGWLYQRALADKADARIFVTNELGARTWLDGEERCFATLGARRAQKPVARENGAERTHEHGLDMHAGKIEIFRVRAGLVPGNLAEAGETQSPMST